MVWYYEINRERQGPVDQSEFDQLVVQGTIKSETLIWREGMADWQAYSSLGGSGSETETCVVSQKRYPKREMIQYEGKWISAEHRDEYFQRVREGVTLPGQFSYGSFGARFCAKFIDGIILFVVGSIINVALAVAFLGHANFFIGVTQASSTSRIMYQAFSNLSSIGLALIYMIFFIAKYSATPGKMALGLKLVRADGSRLATGRIIGRYFAEWLSKFTLCIGYIMAGFDPELRSLHDRICDTRVIRAK